MDIIHKDSLTLTNNHSFDLRLKEEIEKIRLLYKNYEGEMKISIKSIFDKKVSIY